MSQERHFTSQQNGTSCTQYIKQAHTDGHYILYQLMTRIHVLFENILHQALAHTHFAFDTTKTYILHQFYDLHLYIHAPI